MGHNAKTDPPWQPTQFVCPTIRIPQPDGTLLLKPGKPVPIEEMITIPMAAKLIGMSNRWVESECQSGRFTTASKAGLRPNCHWKIARSEVLSRRQSDPS